MKVTFSVCVCLCGQGTKGHTGASGLMGPPGPPGAQGRPGPPGPPATGAHTDYCLRCNTVPYCNAAPCCLLSYTLYFAGLFSVGEKGEMGLPGPPGHCECDSKVNNNAPFGSYTHRSPFDKVPAVRPGSSKTKPNICFCSKSPSYFTFCCTHVWMCVDICGGQRGGDGACAPSQCTSVQKGPEGAVLQG